MDVSDGYILLQTWAEELSANVSKLQLFTFPFSVLMFCFS